jgi:hypothetical protein
MKGLASASSTWALVALCVVTTFACASRSRAPAGGTSASPSEVAPTGSSRVWLAVYDVAANPRDLSDERTVMVDALGDALEGSVVVSPTGCFDGLPTDIDPSDYVLALQQPERTYLKALAEQLDGHPRFMGAVTVSCTD